MHAFLFPLGFLTAAVGFVAIGFGLPDKAFSFGNTLIIAGTIAAVGGFILIALASAIRHLSHIAANSAAHPSPMPLPMPSVPMQQADPFYSRAPAGIQPAPAMTPPPAPPRS